MIATSTLLTYVGVVAALFLLPGPAVLLVMARSISGGRPVGVATAVGIAIGDVFHTLLAVLGLSAMLMSSALLFDIVKYAGVAYLVWLGVSALRAPAPDLTLPNLPRLSPLRAGRQAVITELLNPKTAIFFLSFLPQFTDAAQPLAPQLLLLGAIFVAMSVVYTVALACVAAATAGWVTRRPAFGRWLNRLTGSVLVGLGVHLAFQQRN